MTDCDHPLRREQLLERLRLILLDTDQHVCPPQGLALRLRCTDERRSETLDIESLPIPKEDLDRVYHLQRRGRYLLEAFAEQCILGDDRGRSHLPHEPPHRLAGARPTPAVNVPVTEDIPRAPPLHECRVRWPRVF